MLGKGRYQRLLADLSRLLAEGREAAEAAAAHVTVVTYFRVGQRVLREQLTSRAGYGDAVVARLASELGLHSRILQQAIAFARLYEAPPEPGLSWSHYRELLLVKDGAARAFYAQRAREAGWTTRRLAEAIRSDAYEVEEQRQRESRGGKGKGKDKGKGKGAARGRKLARPKEATHVYEATVARVIDGDTLLLHIDLGFEVLKVQRLRLAALDAAPVESEAGKQARDFVLERLAHCESVVVKTNRHDVHGRYVGHVFYAHRPMAAAEVFVRGRYLNQELLDEGLAEPY